MASIGTRNTVQTKALGAAFALCACRDFSLPDDLPSSATGGTSSSLVAEASGGTKISRQATATGSGGRKIESSSLTAVGGTANATGDTTSNAESGGIGTFDTSAPMPPPVGGTANASGGTTSNAESGGIGTFDTSSQTPPPVGGTANTSGGTTSNAESGGTGTSSHTPPAVGGNANASGGTTSNAESGGTAGTLDLLNQLSRELITLEFAPEGDFAQKVESTAFAYTTHTGGAWCARVFGNVFEHAQNCSLLATHYSTVIDYVSWTGFLCSAAMNGKAFTVIARDGGKDCGSSTVVNYKYGNDNWSMRIK